MKKIPVFIKDKVKDIFKDKKLTHVEIHLKPYTHLNTYLNLYLEKYQKYFSKKSELIKYIINDVELPLCQYCKTMLTFKQYELKTKFCNYKCFGNYYKGELGSIAGLKGAQTKLKKYRKK